MLYTVTQEVTERLRGYRSMGSGPGHHADSPTRSHAPARQVRRDPQGADRPGPQGVRARPDPMGRGVVEPTDRRRSVTAGGLRPGRQVGPGELRRPPESRAPALATGT